LAADKDSNCGDNHGKTPKLVKGERERADFTGFEDKGD